MVMAAAVKTKQTVDPANADALEAAIDLCCKMSAPAEQHSCPHSAFSILVH